MVAARVTLRELRIEKGYNQLYLSLRSPLATLASVSEDFLSLVEHGISAPSFETIETRRGQRRPADTSPFAATASKSAR